MKKMSILITLIILCVFSLMVSGFASEINTETEIPEISEITQDVDTESKPLKETDIEDGQYEGDISANADIIEENTGASESLETDSFNNVYGTVKYSGICGADENNLTTDSLKWEFCSNSTENVLVISGSGDMKNYGDSHAVPWKDLHFEKAIIENGVTSIGDYAFMFSYMKEIEIANSVTKIGRNAFSCSKLENIYIPDNVSEIKNDIFLDSSYLESIEVSDLNLKYYSVEGVLYDKINNSVVKYPEGKSDRVYTILPGTRKVETYAFSRFNCLEEVIIPKGISTIDNNAFYWCPKLRKVDLPNTLINISNSAFFHCISLESIYIPCNVDVSDDPFLDVVSLTVIYGVKGSSAEKYANMKGVTFLEVSDPEKGHIWNKDATIDKPATTSQSGCKSIHCSLCDAIKPGSEQTIPQIISTDPVESFVQRLYIEILGRDADPSGLEAWTDVLKSGREQGAKVAQGFVDSVELKNRNLTDEAYIEALYRTFLDRESDNSGLLSWKKVLDSGLSRMHVFKGFAESVEFTEICEKYGIIRGNVSLTEPRDRNEGVTLFIIRCYNLCLGRKADIEGLNNWCLEILKGNTTAKDAAHGFIFSEEFINMGLSDEEFIKTLYQVFMDRQADPSGLSAWVKVLKTGKDREHVFNGFADSVEFREICERYGMYWQ